MIISFIHGAVLLLSFYSITLAALKLSSPPQNDALSLLAFKSKADFSNKLRFSINTTSTHCNWQGVQCRLDGKVVRLVLEDLRLAGVFAANTLTRLDQLRVLSLQNNSLTGRIPDLTGLVNLKALFLDHNSFRGAIPPSISSLHRLRTLDLSYNKLSGVIPVGLTNLDRLNYLRLDSNRFNGSIPPLNQSSLQIFNVSINHLSGPVPVTRALAYFTASSFLSNPGLCGEIVHTECHSIGPFFRGNSTAAHKLSPPPQVVLGQNAQLPEGKVGFTNSNSRKHKRLALMVGFSAGVLVLITSILCILMSMKTLEKKKRTKDISTTKEIMEMAEAADAAAEVMRMEEANELEEKVRKLQQGMAMGKSGNLVFCAGETHLYSLEQLMRASAELLGRGTVATTYKAVLDNRLIVCVKRLDAGRLAGTTKEAFERHMEAVGGLRHPNLVPLRAYFQANEERLLVYDYQANGSLFSLIHGSKSTRAKPLHWTSCLKIAEDVAQGLSYIHQAWRLVHGNLKSSNVLLGSDFEACLTDYCLSALSRHPPPPTADSAAYEAPETRKLNHQPTAKSDVYSFGVLVLELLTGKPAPEHPHLMPDEMVKWVKSARDEGGAVAEDHRLVMLIEVAVVCSVSSPEQRPTMWQVLKMIQEIKEVAVVEDYGLELDPPNGI